MGAWMINLLGFKVNVMERQSMVNFGPALLVDSFISTKQNYAFGELNGDLSPVILPVNFVTDPDVSDSNSVKGSVV